MALSARPWSAVGGLAVVLVAAGAALAHAGVPADDVVRWLAVVVIGVLVPGVVAVRALRGPGALSEDLAWAVPVGLLLALMTWALRPGGRASGVAVVDGPRRRDGARGPAGAATRARPRGARLGRAAVPSSWSPSS